MRIKHSKYKNTGLLYELLIKQIASDTLSRKDSIAVKLLKKYFSGNTNLAKELRLYEFIEKNINISSNKAEAVLSTITDISRKINYSLTKKEKYSLVSEIKEHYNIDEFFSIKVPHYKAYAALYCLLEAQNNDSLVDPQVFIDNKTTILEHLTQSKQDINEVKESLIDEYGKYDKDLKLLTYKILLEKFNNKYSSLLPEQKEILREFIISVSSTTKLRSFVNDKLSEIKDSLNNLVEGIEDDIVKIKITEIARNITLLSNKDKVDDDILALLMEYYELIKEIKKA